jgi:hypothetical protein
LPDVHRIGRDQANVPVDAMGVVRLLKEQQPDK